MRLGDTFIGRWAGRLAGCAAVLAMTFAGTTALAGAANAKHLAADTKWYIHLDVEAAKETVLYTQMLDVAKQQFPLEETLAQLKAAIGVNPLTDISGITIYNNSFEKDVAAILIYAKVDQNMLANAVAQNPNYKETDYNKHKVMTWTDPNDGKTKTGSFYGDGLVIMADKVDTLKAAMDVLDGAKPAGSELVKTPAKGSFLNASAKLGEANDPNMSKLLSATDAATATISEVGGILNVSLNLTAKTPEQATQARTMLEGIKAMGQLGAADVPTAAGLIRSVKLAVDGAKINISFEHDSKEIIQTLQKLDAEKKAKDARNKNNGGAGRDGLDPKPVAPSKGL